MKNMIDNTVFETDPSSGINQIDLDSEQLTDYHDFIVDLAESNHQDLKKMNFYRRYKHQFITYHTLVYDKQFKCCSYLVSYNNDESDRISYGKIIVFYKYNDQYFAIIQKYNLSKKKITDFLELPEGLLEKVNELYPLLELTDDYKPIPVENFRHKCISIPFQDTFCLSEIRIDFEHD